MKYYGARYYDPKWSSFISVDPLAEKTMDAYGYCYQNPINLVDPDGSRAEPPNDDIITVVSNKKGDSHYVQRDVSMKVTLTVVNSTGADLSETMFNQSSGTVSLKGLSGNAQKDFRNNDITTNDNLKNVSVQYKVVNSIKDVGKDDHVMILVGSIPKISGETGDPVGRAELGGRISAVEVGTLKNKTFNQVATHELGHNLGLEHGSGGLMKETVNPSFSTNSRERGEAVYNQVGPYQGNGTYQQSKSGTPNYKSAIQSQINSFLSNNKIK